MRDRIAYESVPPQLENAAFIKSTDKISSRCKTTPFYERDRCALKTHINQNVEQCT